MHHNSNFDRMPVTHAKLVLGIPGHSEPVTDEDWVALGGFPEELPQIRREARLILDSITPQQQALLKRAVHDLSIDMNALQIQIRDQALS